MTRRVVALAWALVVLVAAHALGQDITAPNRYDAVEKVYTSCPDLILQDHAFTDAVASLLYAEDPNWGRNGKRGNVDDPSHDAIAWRNPASPAGGVSIVDIIASAGIAAARPAWQDVTQATIDAGTIGVWAKPSGVLPACLSPVTPPPVIVPPPVEPPAPVCDLDAVLVELARIENRLTVLERGLAAHDGDMKARTDVIRETLEQLDAWLRSRRVLRY